MDEEEAAPHSQRKCGGDDANQNIFSRMGKASPDGGPHVNLPRRIECSSGVCLCVRRPDGPPPRRENILEQKAGTNACVADESLGGATTDGSSIQAFAALSAAEALRRSSFQPKELNDGSQEFRTYLSRAEGASSLDCSSVKPTEVSERKKPEAASNSRVVLEFEGRFSC